jgi:hypothetical protein
MPIPTELVGSLPRAMKLQEAYADYDEGKIEFDQLQALQDEAAEDSIKRLEATGEPTVTDGEQRESSFATYNLTDTLAGTGLADGLAGDGQASSQPTGTHVAPRFCILCGPAMGTVARTTRPTNLAQRESEGRDGQRIQDISVHF